MILSTPTILLALLGQAILTLIEPALGRLFGLVGGALAAQLLFIGLLTVVLWRAIRIDHAPRDALGFAGTGWWTVLHTPLIWLFLFFGYRIISFFVIQVSGLPGYLDGADAFYDLPLWLQITDVVLISAGLYWLLVVIAIEGLRGLGLARWQAVLLPVLLLSVPHLPYWGPGPTLVLGLSSLVLCLFYLWRRDVLALIIADLAVDLYNTLVAAN